MNLFNPLLALFLPPSDDSPVVTDDSGDDADGVMDSSIGADPFGHSGTLLCVQDLHGEGYLFVDGYGC